MEAPRKPKLTRLKIESLRNVEPCELRFGDGFNVLLGLNATGKTTLLELIAAALSFDFSKFKEEAFAVEYELAFSTGTIVVSMRNERVEHRRSRYPMRQVSGQGDVRSFGAAADAFHEPARGVDGVRGYVIDVDRRAGGGW